MIIASAAFKGYLNPVCSMNGICYLLSVLVAKFYLHDLEMSDLLCDFLCMVTIVQSQLSLGKSPAAQIHVMLSYYCHLNKL